MRKFILLILFVIGFYDSHAQCLTNSITINTGYDPITGTAIVPGIDGGTPVPDPYWIVTAETPGIATAIFSTGLIEVVPGFAADVITRWSGWAIPPTGIASGYLGCLNSSVYTTDGTGPTGTAYTVHFARTFRMCADDTITLDLYFANDNYISATDIDGVPLAFAQPALPTVTHYSTFTHFTQTVFLTAGIHTFNVVQSNYNVIGATPNPVGMNIYGTFTSATATSSIISESFPACASYACTGTCNAISLVDTIHPCSGDVITLPATIVGPDSILSILWSPVTGLSSSTVAAPTLTVGATSGYYNITVRSLIPFNLVTNGNFSGGNTGFSSSYIYAPGPSSVLLEGNYSIYDNPFSVHTGFTRFGDHTTGTGNMMIINGGATPTDVWCQTIPVTPNTDYDFSAWIANCSSVTVGIDVPILQFRINGVLIGTPTTISSAPGVWTNFFNVWNSGLSTTANICIYDLNTTPAGNDFVLDDISFNEICIAEDSVYIDIRIPDTTSTRTDTTLCITAAPISLRATPGYTSYEWNTGSFSSSIFAFASGTFWVYNKNACETLIDTFGVDYIPVPVVSLGTDTAFCIGNTLVLSSPQPTGSTYLWSTGSTSDSIHVSTSGSYWLRVDNGYCTVTNTINVLVSPFPVVDLGPDTVSCSPSPITLQSSVPYTSPLYLWNDASTGPSVTTSVSGTFWLRVTVGGCPATDTIHVTILYDTFKLSNNDTAICFGKSVPVFLTANPAATFQWLPTAGIGAPTIATPVITPDTSAMYYVHIFLTGCPEIVDSFFIDVQPYPLVYMGGSKTVCEFDTLHLRARVTPNWYTRYAYSWTPSTYLDDTTQGSVIFRAGDTTKLTLTVTTPAGCVGSDSAIVTVYPGNFAKLDTVVSLCPHDSVQLVATGGISYLWMPAFYLSDSTVAAPWVHAITSQKYTIVAKSIHGCLDTLTSSVIIRPAAHISIEDSVTIYPGESYHITPQTNCVSFAWFPPSGLNNSRVSDPVITPLLSARYIVEGTTEWGCKTSDTINVRYEISSLITVPNAFTPGSSVNNKFKLIKRGEATLNYFRIFNRWGNMVFETKDIDEGWDGTYKGKPQPFGVFVYEIEAETGSGVVFAKHGNVTLVR